MCAFSYAHLTFCSCDLDLDPITMTYELDLDILKMYLPIKNEVSRSRLSKATALTRQTDTQTDRRDRQHYQPYSRVLNIVLYLDSGF